MYLAFKTSPKTMFFTVSLSSVDPFRACLSGSVQQSTNAATAAALPLPDQTESFSQTRLAAFMRGYAEALPRASLKTRIWKTAESLDGWMDGRKDGRTVGWMGKVFWSVPTGSGNNLT